MITSAKGKLSLKDGHASLESVESTLVVGLQDVLLPGRQFLVSHKVAVLGDVSLTTEFLLRLLHSVGDMDEADVASFFGFDDREMKFVVGEAESRAYVERSGGVIALTEAGYSLFKADDRPMIFEVQSATENVGFDLISLAPCERDRLAPFESAFPELDLRDAHVASAASKAVPDAFRRHFTEICGRRDRDASAAAKKALYSVDDVVAGDRFSSVVTIALTASSMRPSSPEPILDTWKTGHELVVRKEVVNSIAEFVEKLQATRGGSEEAAYDALLELAPDYLKDYRTRDGLSAARFLRSVAERAGELRSDRKTVGIVGPIFAPDNFARLQKALDLSASNEGPGSGTFVWIAPVSSTWGATRALSTALDELGRREPDSAARSVIVCAGRPPWHLRKVFDVVLQRSNDALPAPLEILLFPKRAVVALAHSPVNTNRGFPVPLGFMSFDTEVVRRAHAYLNTQLPRRLNVFESATSFDLAPLTLWDSDNTSASDSAAE